MKKLTLIAMATIFVLAMQSCSIFKKGSKEGFEGVVFYTIDYPESDFGDEIKSQLPMGMTVYIKGNMVKSDISSAMYNQTIITNRETNQVDQLMELMGQKFHITKSAGEIKKELENAPETEVEHLDETKEIAGYKARKVKITQKKENGEQIYTAWINKELGSNFLATSNVMQKVDGFPLEYEFDAARLTMHLTASKVERKNIKDKVFDIPEGYEKVTEEELKNRFGGM
ncbi:MAG: DUF4412 domain-containing protein [Bacteroidales bacterium]|nr:DUF4412 domain-containing protein [Bacteroidales bacterium]